MESTTYESSEKQFVVVNITLRKEVKVIED
jgi:hypothetical protein